MGKLFAAIILITCSPLCFSYADKADAYIESGSHRCQIYFESAGRIPSVCFADMHMLASKPEAYCDKNVIVFGYLDYQDRVFYSNKELADAQFIEVSATLADGEALKELRKMSPSEKGEYVTLKGRFRCIADMSDWPGAGIGEFYDIEAITHYDRNEIDPKERVIYRKSEG